MVDTFHSGYFGFLAQEVDVERQTLKGGTALSGEQDTVSTDGGGRVFAEFAEGSLVDRHKVLAWRAITGRLEEGVTPIVVEFCDIRHQPYGPGWGGVPHSDDTPFSDSSLYVLGEVGGPVVTDAPLRATTLLADLTLPQPLIGGEWFSIEHPNKGWRAYKVVGIDGRAVAFRPPLREAVTAGERVDFHKPRCLMVVDGRPGSRLDVRRQTTAAIRFVEAP